MLSYDGSLLCHQSLCAFTVPCSQHTCQVWNAAAIERLARVARQCAILRFSRCLSDAYSLHVLNALFAARCCSFLIQAATCKQHWHCQFLHKMTSSLGVV